MGKTIRARFPHHDWADADGLDVQDPDFAESHYYRNDPDSYSERLRGWHQRLWTKPLPTGTVFDLQPSGRGLRDGCSGILLKSDSAIPAWENWTDVQHLLTDTETLLDEAGRGSIHDLGWRLYDMGGMILFPGEQVDRQWTINQAKGCTKAIADRLDLTLECIRLHYAGVHDPIGNPLGSVFLRYADFFELFVSFEQFVEFWLLQDLVSTGESGTRVKFMLGRNGSGEYDFAEESGLPTCAEEYASYLIAADEFVAARNQRMADVAVALGYEVSGDFVRGDGG